MTDQLGGLVCYQTDYNNDGRMDVFIPAGPGHPHPVRPTLLRNNGAGASPTSPRRRGFWTRSIPTPRPGPITTTTAGSTCSLAASSSPTACITIAAMAPSRRSPRRPACGGRTGQLFCKGVAWIDFDNDDDPDLFINNLGGPAELHRNNRDGTFTDVTSPMGIDGPYRRVFVLGLGL